MTSTKLIRVHTDPLNTRLTTAEAKVATIETRGLVELGDNISELNNDAQYQTLSQVNAIADTKINALIDSAPGTLNTLGEIATALADDDSAIAALVAVNTSQNTAIAAIQTVNTAQDTAIEDLQTDVIALQDLEYGITISQGDGFFQDGLTQNLEIFGATLSQLAPGYINVSITSQSVGLSISDSASFPPNVYNVGNALNYLGTNFNFQNTAISALEASITELDASDIPVTHPPVSYSFDQGDGMYAESTVENHISYLDNSLNSLNQQIQSTNANHQGQIDRLAATTSIRRLEVAAGSIALNNNDAYRQHALLPAGDLTLTLPSDPFIGKEFEVINNATSVFNVLFAGETIVPGTRHAVQWDGVEWVIL